MGFLDELFSAGVWGEKTPTPPKWKKWTHPINYAVRR